MEKKLLAENIDSIIIFTIIVISSILGFWQEKGAADALAELNKLIQAKCNARDQKYIETTIEYIVAGDTLSLSAGNLIPADC
jgi:Mg2+-importing ATPase